MSKPYIALAALADSARGEGECLPLKLLKLDELLQHPFREREPILGDWLLTSWLGDAPFVARSGEDAYSARSGVCVGERRCVPALEGTHTTAVFYIDGEMPGSSLAQRMAGIVASAVTEAEPGNFPVLTPDAQPEGMPDLATPEGQADVDAAINGCDAELIVVDNLSCLVRGGRPENDVESWQPVSTWALSHRKRGQTILFVYHSGKNGAQRGTSKREDILDTVIALKRSGDYSPTEGARFEVHFEKQGRQRPAIRIAPSCRAKVLEMKGLGMSATEIASELGIHRSTVYRNFKEAT